MELANDVLEKAFLPAFYIPHILERSFLISLCMNGLESENEDIFYFVKSPYADICCDVSVFSLCNKSITRFIEVCETI